MLVNLFPSPILIFDGVYSNPDLVATVATTAVQQATKQPDWDCNIRTSFAQGSDLHKHKSLAPFISVVQEYASQYSDIYFRRQAIIRHSWANMADQWQYQEYHNHLGSHCAFSGVYYAQSDDQERIIFHSPYQNIVALNQPDVQLVPAKQNRLILFPSYLGHSFKGWARPLVKVSVAFNFNIQ